VTVEGRDEVRIVVGDYLVHVEKDGAIQIGMRTGEDASSATLDETKPRIEMTEKNIALRVGKLNKGSTLFMEKDNIVLFEGPTQGKSHRAQLDLKNGEAWLFGGSDSAFIAKEGALMFQATKVTTKKSKVKVLKLNVGDKVEIG
jgi:hypothetical protein